jgi:hypothetical protein
MDRWLIGGALLGLLGLALWVGYREWTVAQVDVPAWALVPMALGVGFSLLVGGGLMTLIFYSSRKGYDEPPRRIERKEDEE